MATAVFSSAGQHCQTQCRVGTQRTSTGCLEKATSIAMAGNRIDNITRHGDCYSVALYWVFLTELPQSFNSPKHAGIVVSRYNPWTSAYGHQNSSLQIEADIVTGVCVYLIPEQRVVMGSMSEPTRERDHTISIVCSPPAGWRCYSIQQHLQYPGRLPPTDEGGVTGAKYA